MAEDTVRGSIELAGLPADAVLDEIALAAALGVPPRTVRRMIRRYELPAGVKLGCRRIWLAGRVLAWIHAAAEKQERAAALAAEKIQRYSA